MHAISRVAMVVETGETSHHANPRSNYTIGLDIAKHLSDPPITGLYPLVNNACLCFCDAAITSCAWA